jgi:hypothetical protein
VQLDGVAVVLTVQDLGVAIDECQCFTVADGDLKGGVYESGLDHGTDAINELVEALPGAGGYPEGVGSHLLEEVDDGFVGDGIGFVEQGEGGQVAAADIGEDLIDDVELEVGLGAGGIDNVKKEVGVDGLLEGSLEGGDQVVGKVADEADGVGEEDGFAVAQIPSSGFGVQGGE